MPASNFLIRSMTGFGRAEQKINDLPVHIELKSINHRYREIRFRLPREMNYLEPELRQIIQDNLARGRIEVSIHIGTTKEELPTTPFVNIALAEQYLQLHYQLAEHLGLTNSPPTTTQILNFPGVLQQKASPEILEALEKILRETLSSALEKLLIMRQKEGEFLRQDIEEKLTFIQKNVAIIEERAPEVAKIHYEKLTKRLASYPLPKEIDEERLYQELAIWSDKSDISEEITRLKSHLEQFFQLLQKGGVVGRQCDFLCQELNREVNTIGSKNHDPQIANLLIPLKSTIEKIREQVQNIE